MEPYYADATVTVYAGDCLDVLRTLPDASVDAVVTDPPYGLEFMGKEWDGADGFRRSLNPNDAGRDDPFGRTSRTSPEYRTDSKAAAGMSGTGYTDGATRLDRPSHLGGLNPKCRICERWQRGGNPCTCEAPDFPNERLPRLHSFQEWCEAWSRECLRVLKPGGHLLAFGGTRTSHRLACAVEDAGFEIRDSIAWLYGSGFPKSLDVSRAIDKAAGAEREVVGTHNDNGRRVPKHQSTHGAWEGLVEVPITAPATPDAERWQGWGTALKPAWEIVVCGRKPLPLLDRIGSHLDALERSWRPTASSAASSSAPTPADSPEAKTASAPASAVTPPEGEPARTTATGRAAVSSAATATSASESMAATCSNTVTSWRRCLGALSEPTSTSTTETTSSTTTDLTTLWSCLSRITGPSTLLDPTSPDGLSSLARAVDSLFAAAVLSSNATRMLIATGPAISPTQPPSPAGGALSQIVVARKPLAGTVAQTVLAHGTGALNVDGCRIEGDTPQPFGSPRKSVGGILNTTTEAREQYAPSAAGRWPANVCLDESQAAALDLMSGESRDGTAVNRNRDGSDMASWYGTRNSQTGPDLGYGGEGGASRFMYVAKADASERPRVNGISHATVKPLALMRWLVRLVCPPGGTILEPFAGSGTTVEACILEGFRCIAIEREADYLPLIVQRINRRRDPVAAVRSSGEDGGLFDLLDGGAA